MTDMKSCDLLITGGLILTLDDDDAVIRDGAIAVVGRRIAEIGASGALARRWHAHRTVDARDRIVMPGLVNIHNHTPLMITRGMIEDIGFAPAYTPGVPQGHHLTPEDAYLMSRLGMYELLRAGCTTIVDYYRYPESCARAAAELGLRAVIGGRIHDVDVAALTEGRRVYNAATRDATMMESDSLIARWDGHDAGRIRCDLAPHAPDTCSRELLREIAALAARRGGNVHTHLAQSADEVAIVKARDGITPTELLDDCGLLDERLIAAHCIWLEASDVARVGKARTIVAHSPIGNAKSGTIAPIRALRDAGARITLCTDGYTGDLFEAMRWAIAMLRVRGEAFETKARDALRWATASGAEAIGYGAEIGALEAGRRADIVLVDATSPRVAPVIDGVGILVHSASGNDVRSVIVDGRVCIDDGALVMADGPAIVREAQRAAEKLWKRAGRVAITEAPT